MPLILSALLPSIIYRLQCLYLPSFLIMVYLCLTSLSSFITPCIFFSSIGHVSESWSWSRLTHGNTAYYPLSLMPASTEQLKLYDKVKKRLSLSGSLKSTLNHIKEENDIISVDACVRSVHDWIERRMKSPSQSSVSDNTRTASNLPYTILLPFLSSHVRCQIFISRRRYILLIYCRCCPPFSWVAVSTAPCWPMHPSQLRNCSCYATMRERG